MAGVTNSKNKHSAYKYIYKMRIQKALTYRFDVFSSIIFQCIVMFATTFFWRAIYFFEDLGNITSLFFLNVIPIILMGSIFITVPLPANGMYAALQELIDRIAYSGQQGKGSE